MRLDGAVLGLGQAQDQPQGGQKQARDLRGQRARGEGIVNWVSGSLDPVTRTVKIRCNVPNPQRLLKPEMFAKVLLEAPGRTVLAVPRSALVRIGDLVYVLVDLGPLPDGGRHFERRPVQADEHQSGDLVPVLGGLKAGEPVVVKGALQLSGVNG